MASHSKFSLSLWFLPQVFGQNIRAAREVPVDESVLLMSLKLAAGATAARL